jgi:hypothetical protein
MGRTVYYYNRVLRPKKSNIETDKKNGVKRPMTQSKLPVQDSSIVRVFEQVYCINLEYVEAIIVDHRKGHLICNNQQAS